MTREIAVSPPDGGLEAFDWRLSMASVSAAGRFSHFGGVDRSLAVIEGRLQLAFDDGVGEVVLTPESPPHEFSGEAGVLGTPLDGPVLDLNLMTARGRYRGRIQRTACSDAVTLASPCAFVLLGREGRLRWNGETIDMRPFDALRLDGAAGDVVSFDGGGDVYVVSLFAEPQDDAPSAPLARGGAR